SPRSLGKALLPEFDVTLMIFATFVLERDPLKWSDVIQGLQTWAQDAGGFALFGLILYVGYRLFAGPPRGGLPPSKAQRVLAILGVLVMLVGYGAYVGMEGPLILGSIVSVFSGEAVRSVA